MVMVMVLNSADASRNASTMASRAGKAVLSRWEGGCVTQPLTQLAAKGGFINLVALGAWAGSLKRKARSESL